MAEKTELDKTLTSLKDLNDRLKEGMDFDQYLEAVDHLIKDRKS